MTDAPVLTTAAAQQVRACAQADNNPNLRLRVWVAGGGCSGFQYSFEFDDQVGEDDAEITANGARVVVDSISYPFLQGAQIDFARDLKGEHFVIHNPNADATCGCGTSFSM